MGTDLWHSIGGACCITGAVLIVAGFFALYTAVKLSVSGLDE